MKISCEIIKDLLPLYHDGVCGKESSAAVEEHLSYCKSCKAELKAMDEALPINNIKQNLDEAEAVKKLSKRWRKGIWKSLVKGVLVTLLTIAIFVLILYFFIDIRVV